jgi:hypothetical protein
LTDFLDREPSSRFFLLKDALLEMSSVPPAVAGTILQGFAAMSSLLVSEDAERPAHASLEDLGGLGKGAFGGLNEGDGVLRVGRGLVEAAELRSHLLRNGEAGVVVGGGVDRVTEESFSTALAILLLFLVYWV